MAKRILPDDFEKPVPHPAPLKSVVETVLDGVLAAGNSAVSLLAGLLAGVLVLYSGYVIYDTFDTQYRAYSSAWDLLQYKPEIIEDNQTPLSGGKLAEINGDYRAWLSVYDSSIDYPVLQGPDDVYYAWHDIYKNSSLTGAIYMAAQNSRDFSDSYNLIYGHHMDNGAMFGRLDSFKDKSYFDSHREGILITESGVYDVEFFAVANTDAYESRIYTVGNRMDEVLAFLRSGGAGGAGLGTTVLHFDEAAAAGATKIVALSTCAAAETSGRLTVFGKMTLRNLIVLDAVGYSGIYDGKTHSVQASVSVKETLIEYSIDDGATWTTTPPTIKNVGKVTVLVRATSEANGSAQTKVILNVQPKPVTVTAENKTKVFGEKDPKFTAKVVGLLDDDEIEFRFRRKKGEEPGKYRITPEGYPNRYKTTLEGYEIQGNYIINYVPGDLIITPPGIDLKIIKQWENDEEGDRPASVNMVLIGGDTPQTVTLTATNEWTAVVPGMPADRTYIWLEPDVNGYKQTSAVSADGVTTIVNTRVDHTPKDYTLTVHYRYADGRKAAEDMSFTVPEGATYDVTIEAIDGYVAAPSRLTGVMPGRNLEYTVLFIPVNGNERTTLLENYETPPGAGASFVQLGICYE